MSEVQKVETITPYLCKPRLPGRRLTPLGDRYQIKAKLSVDPNGIQIAEAGEKIDLQAYIQASKSSTDMATIVARAKAGDDTVLNVTPNGYYGDTSIIPSSINDYDKLNKLSDIAAEKFEALPVEVKKLFGSSEDFLNAVLNNQVNDILAKAKDEKQAEIEEEKGEEK